MGWARQRRAVARCVPRCLDPSKPWLGRRCDRHRHRCVDAAVDHEQVGVCDHDHSRSGDHWYLGQLSHRLGRSALARAGRVRRDRSGGCRPRRHGDGECCARSGGRRVGGGGGIGRGRTPGASSPRVAVGDRDPCLRTGHVQLAPPPRLGVRCGSKLAPAQVPWGRDHDIEGLLLRGAGGFRVDSRVGKHRERFGVWQIVGSPA